MPYTRNTLVEEALKENPTAGLPLFDQGKKRRSKRLQHIIEKAPRSMRIATDTRKLSHTAITFDPAMLGRKQLLVYDAFTKVDDATNEEIRMQLNFPINRVVGRTFELRQFGLVTFSQKRKCRITGNVVTAWKINSHPQPKEQTS